MAVSEARRRRVMGCRAHLLVEDAPEGAIDRAWSRLRHLEGRWSRFRPDSDVSRLNRAAGAPVTVHPDTVVLLAALTEAWRATDGLCDPTVLPALVAAGGGADRSGSGGGRDLPVAPVAEPSPGLGGLELDVDARTARLPAGVVIDPGAVGKGLAADLVATALVRDGAHGALVNLGGDLRAAGRPPAGGWIVTVSDPATADAGAPPVFHLEVTAGGVATSSSVSRRWTGADGTCRHHVIDSRTGRPADTDLATATVVAATAWEAEAHATATLVSGLGGGCGWLASTGCAGVLVTATGTVVVTPELSRVAA